MLLYLGRTEQDIFFCDRCLLPLPDIAVPGRSSSTSYKPFRLLAWMPDP